MAEQKIKKETATHFNYNRLWKLLIDRGIQKQELQKQSDVSAASIAKMGRCENVTKTCCLEYAKPLTAMSRTLWNVCRILQKKKVQSPDYGTYYFILL